MISLVKPFVAPATAVIAAAAAFAVFPANARAQGVEGAGASPATAATAGPPPAWSIDASHSRIGFSVRHFFTPVEGTFGDYEVDLRFDPAAPEEGRVTVAIEAASIDTDHERRDEDLQGSDFFDSERFPRLTFESTAIRRVSENEFIVAGDLTIRDVTRPVELAVELLGVRELGPDMERYGRMVAGFRAHTTFDRRDFDIGTGRWAETVVLGPDVTVDILLETRLR